MSSLPDQQFEFIRHVRSERINRLFTLVVMIGLLVIGTGCETTPDERPASMTYPAGSYEACFDAVLAVSRDTGMPAVLRDRSGGVVETAPRIAGSIFEPWRQDNASFTEGLANTVSLQRRRARFEFVPADFVAPSAGDPDRLDGAPLPGARGDDLVDMRTHDGPLEVRVWVYIERAFTPGVRSGTWTRSQTTYARNPLAPGTGSDRDDVIIDFSRWTPVRRDPAYECRLLRELSRRMNEPTDAS